jgi:ketosteroid isomerase-like protein
VAVSANTSTTLSADLLEFARRYRAAFGSFEPEQYEPYLAPEPVYHAGMTMRSGRGAFHQNTGSGKVLYPFGALRTTERRAVAEGDWVALLTEREAITNRGAHYDNIYTLFFQVVDGLVTTQVELLDFRVSNAKFDLSALGPELRQPGEQRVPVQVAVLPAADDRSAPANAKRVALRFLDEFLSFEPDRFVDLLGVDPLHQVGMTKRTGRAGFVDIARIGRILYPEGIAERTHHVLVSDGRTVATLLSMRARTNKGVDYENLYGMFLDVHDGRVMSLIEVLDGRVADASFDTSMVRP